MLTPSEIRKQAVNRYPLFVESHFRGESFFPWEVRFGRADSGEPLSQLRQAIEALLSQSHEQTGHGYRVGMAEKRLRLHGAQSLPVRVWFDTAEDYLEFIGQRTEFGKFRADVAAAANAAPEASAWLHANARSLMSRLPRGDGHPLGLAVHALHARPLPGCYPREIPLPGISGKFVEGAIALIADILEGIGSPAWRSAEDSHSALGLKRPPRLIRAMLLDGLGADYGLPAERLICPAGVESVLIVENLHSFLTLPAIPRTLALWGEGHAARTLASIPWLKTTRVFYWGDIDPHGFAILSGLRAEFPAVCSVLMDEVSLDLYAVLLARAEPLVAPRFGALTAGELGAAERTQRDAQGVEQEKIPAVESAEALLLAITHLMPAVLRSPSI